MGKKILALTIVIVCACFFLETPAFSGADNTGTTTVLPPNIKIDRFSGETRYETAKIISGYYNNGKVDHVILATGKDFPDALSASVLAHEKGAPILLVDSSVDRSTDAFNYVIEHLDSSGTVYLVGGTAVIGIDFESKLHDLGFKDIVRIAGADRYDTSYQIAGLLNGGIDSTVVISSGEQYPDALSVSSFAANKGWPILLSAHDALPREIKNFLLERTPSQVYLTGGSGAISDHVQAEISILLPHAAVKRLTGQSRFDTNIILAESFAPHPSTVYLATGYDFADALAGSVPAAENGDPVIFLDPSLPTLPKSAAAYFARLNASHLSPNLVVFGGDKVAKEETVQLCKELISGTATENKIYSIPDLTATVTQNKSYSLPKNVQARLYNSTAVELPVRWDPSIVDTGKLGSSSYYGSVEGYPENVKLTLTIKEPLPIAQYSTRFDPSLINRTENIRLAAKALDEIIIAPGKIFSFNNTVGQRTSQAGYKEALIIEGNSYIPGLGGGICQVSSTLYNAVNLAQLDILERHHHSLPVSYVPPGQDATVSFPDLDFKFRNSKPFPLLIRSLVKENTLTLRIYEN